jgi:hypothetical protein
MKKLLFSLAFIIMIVIPSILYSQNVPVAPGNGVYVLINNTYNIGASAQGNSQARITLQNTTNTKVRGVQFRVFYDKNAFGAASVALLGSSVNLDLQFVDNNANGYATVTLVYTGANSTYTIPVGERFEITFTHVSPATFYTLPSISNLTWTGVNVYSPYSASSTGLDTTLTTYSYGGQWINQALSFHGTFTNVTGSAAKNLSLALEKKVKIGGSWSTHSTYLTDITGDFVINEPIDTTYYDVRLAIIGDTMAVGNAISTADAQLINQWVLGAATPTSWDFYTADVNSSNNVTITDAYGVFGRIAGSFATWPNNTKEIKFFTSSENTTITGSPATNYTSSIPGVTNFYFNILPGQPDSVTFYVLVPGDANSTGYHMARLTPITVLPNTVPGYPLETENIIDINVEYDFPTSSIEVNIPSLSVNEGNLVELPVTLKTNGEDISSLQLALVYDPSILNFKELVNSEKSMFWISSINPTLGSVEWSGYDPSANKSYMIPDNYEIFNLKFLALQPQDEWESSPIFTTKKFSGDKVSKDMSITPTGGIMVVCKMSGVVSTMENTMIVYPNPTSGDLAISFDVAESGIVKLCIVDINGEVQRVILDKYMPQGNYIYSCNIHNLSQGIYIASLQSKKNKNAVRIIKNK